MEKKDKTVIVTIFLMDAKIFRASQLVFEKKTVFFQTMFFIVEKKLFFFQGLVFFQFFFKKILNAFNLLLKVV